jgi:flagellar motor protein MotB
METTPMKLVGIISTAVLSLTLGAAAPAFAQQEQHDQQEEQKAKPAQPEEKKAQPEKPAKQEEKPAAQQENNTKPTEKNAQQQEKNTKPEEKNAQQAQQAGGGRIPADKFKANFGQQHTFRVSQGDYNNHRFQYGGYSFGFVDPWPSNWLYTQNVYVIEINGVYYLCNPMYPGVNIALSFAP